MSIKFKSQSKDKPATKKGAHTTVKKLRGWIIAFCIACVVAIGGSVGFYFLGKNQGYENGAWDGYDLGYTNGYDAGAQDGYRSGYNSGYSVGKNDGYTNGYRRAACIMVGGGWCY